MTSVSPIVSATKSLLRSSSAKRFCIAANVSKLSKSLRTWFWSFDISIIEAGLISTVGWFIDEDAPGIFEVLGSTFGTIFASASVDCVKCTSLLAWLVSFDISSPFTSSSILAADVGNASLSWLRLAVDTSVLCSVALLVMAGTSSTMPSLDMLVTEGAKSMLGWLALLIASKELITSLLAKLETEEALTSFSRLSDDASARAGTAFSVRSSSDWLLIFDIGSFFLSWLSLTEILSNVSVLGKPIIWFSGMDSERTVGSDKTLKAADCSVSNICDGRKLSAEGFAKVWESFAKGSSKLDWISDNLETSTCRFSVSIGKLGTEGLGDWILDCCKLE